MTEENDVTRTLRPVLRWLTKVGSRLPGPIRRAIRSIPLVSRVATGPRQVPTLPGPDPGDLRAVVYLPTWARWDEMRQRPQYLMKAFASAGHRAYFIDPREASPRDVDGVRIVPSLSDVPRSGVILMVHFAPLRELFDLFDDPVIVYDIHDDLTIYGPDESDVPPERRVIAHHGTVIASADVTIVSLDVLGDRHRSEAPNLIVIENGVESAAFQAPTPSPSDLPDTEGPVIGYHGALSYWFDFDLVHDVARMRPEWEFVLVGPVLPAARDDAERISALTNVHLLGEKPSDDIPAYVQRFDVGLIPFRIDTMTVAVSPLKMFEYLAVPVPVVSTPLPAATRTEVVRTARDPEDFVAAVEAALDDRDGPDFRSAAAIEVERAEWSSRIEPILDRLDALGRLRVPK